MPIDPRLGLAQKVLPTEGRLLARIADLERRLTAQEQTHGFRLTPGATANYQGPWATVIPPNGTTGASFAITVTGTYAVICAVSVYHPSAIQALTVDVYVDAVLKGTIRGFTNEANSHKALVPLTFTSTFTVGTHYIYYRTTAGASDISDYGSMLAIQVA